MATTLGNTTSEASTKFILRTRSGNSDNNTAAIIDAGIQLQNAPQPQDRNAATSTSFVNLPLQPPAAAPADPGIFSTVTNATVNLWNRGTTAIRDYLHPPHVAVEDIQLALRNHSQSVQDPLFPNSVYVNGQMNYTQIEQMIGMIHDHYRASMGELPADDQVSQFLNDMPASIARRVERQLKVEQNRDLLTTPPDQLKLDGKTRLDRVMLRAAADKWTALGNLILSVIIQESTDHDLVGLTLQDNPAAASQPSTHTTSAPANPLRHPYLHELRNFCLQQANYIRAINMPNTMIVAGQDMSSTFNNLGNSISPLTPPIGATRSTQNGGRMTVTLKTPYISTPATATEEEKPFIDLRASGSGQYTSGISTSTDTDGDCNYTPYYNCSGEVKAALTSPVFSVNVPGQASYGFQDYFESLQPAAACAASLLNTAYAPPPSQTRKTLSSMNSVLNTITRPFLGGERPSQAQKDAASFSTTTHNGLYETRSMHKSAAKLDTFLPQTHAIGQGDTTERLELRPTAAAMLPSPTERIHARGPIEPTNANLQLRGGPIQVPFSMPATPSSRVDPTQAEPYPWSVTTYSASPNAKVGLRYEQYFPDPNSPTVFSPTGSVMVQPHHVESRLPLTRPYAYSGQHPHSFPEDPVIEVSRVIQAIRQRTALEPPSMPNPALPFGDSSGLYLLNKHFPRDRESGQPLVNTAERLYPVPAETAPQQLYASRDQMHPVFQHLLQGLELCVGSDLSAGLDPKQAFEALHDSYRETSADYAEVTRLIWDAKSAARSGEVDEENAALQRIKHIVFNDQHGANVTATSSEKEKDDLCVLAVQMFDLQFNTLDLMLEMAKATHGALQTKYGVNDPDMENSNLALQATQKQRDCSCEHFISETGGIPRSVIARSHFLQANSASKKDVNGVTFNVTMDLAPRDAVDATRSWIKNWIPTGSLLGSKTAQVRINGTVDFADQFQHPAWHREAKRTDISVDLTTTASLVGVPIAVLAGWMTEACMSNCQGMDDETALQQLSHELKDFFTKTLAEDGLMNSLSAGHGVRFELRLERTHPEKDEITVNRRAYSRYGLLVQTDNGLSLFPSKIKDYLTIPTSIGGISFDPESISKTSSYEVRGSHVGDSVRAALTMYPRLLSVISRTPTNEIDFQATHAAFTKSVHKPELHMWFGGKKDPFASIVADALQAQEHALDAPGPTTPYSEINYALKGREEAMRTPNRATLVTPLYAKYRASTRYTGPATPAKSNFTKLRDVLNQLSEALLGRPYTPEYKEELLAAISNFSAQGGNAQARLARYLNTSDGQAIFQAADSILALLGGHSTLVRLGSYYRTQADENTINYFFGPERQPSDTVAPSDIELATVTPLPPHIHAVEDKLAIARRNERAMIYESANADNASGTLPPTGNASNTAANIMPPPTTVQRRILSYPIDERRTSINSDFVPLTTVSLNRGAISQNRNQGSVVTTRMRRTFGAENMPDYGTGTDYGTGYDEGDESSYF